MKFNIAILLAAVQVTGVFSVALPNPEGEVSNTELECGDLGVMRSYKAEELPNGVDAEDIRNCAEHPLGRNPPMIEVSRAPMSADEREPWELGFSSNDPKDSGVDALEKRKCEWGAPYGCSDGYCWKSCGGAGEWCWTAANAGFGSWFTCDKFSDCGQHTFACGRGGCDACGCSC